MPSEQDLRNVVLDLGRGKNLEDTVLADHGDFDVVLSHLAGIRVELKN